MTKFGKKLRQRKIKEWEGNYIDYKGLKHFIKENNDPSKKFIFKMVKFGKKLREKKIKQWEEDYIDYKALKQFIKKK